jgi:hypothetical protein
MLSRYDLVGGLSWQVSSRFFSNNLPGSQLRGHRLILTSEDAMIMYFLPRKSGRAAGILSRAQRPCCPHVRPTDIITVGDFRALEGTDTALLITFWDEFPSWSLGSSYTCRKSAFSYQNLSSLLLALSMANKPAILL